MDATAINEILKKYGLNEQRSPLWRLVWSTDQREVRIGTFNEFYGSIFVRKIHGAHEVPKYPFLKDRWILENWIPPHKAYTPELPNSREGSYEPIFVFEDNQHNPLPLRIDVCEICIQYVNSPTKSKMLRESEEREKVARKERAEQQRDEDALEVSPLTNALHMREGIAYTKEIKDANV